MSAFIDIAGQTYGRLRVVEFVRKAKGGARWLCECECGNKKIVSVASLRGGKTRSCGCLASDIRRGGIDRRFGGKTDHTLDIGDPLDELEDIGR